MNFFTFHLGVKRKFYWDCLAAFEPYGSFDYHYLRQKRFSESGSESIALSVKAKSQDMLRAEVGARASRECSEQKKFCYAPYVGLGIAIDYPIERSLQRASFKGTCCAMKVLSYEGAIHMFSPQAGIKWTHSCGLSFLLGYKGLLGDKTRTHQGNVRLEWVF